MDILKTISLLMSAAVILVGLAQKMRIPYPIALVLGGAVVGFIPGVPAIHFDPNTILTIVLPPILFYASFWIPFREFKKNWREIFSLALGLVIATTFVVGVVFKWLIPQAPWALAFAFGAIVSPPDAVATGAILKRFSIGSRLLTVLEGESLVNDASALVLFRLTVLTLLSGTFSFAEAGVEFVEIVIGGIGIGLITGIILQMFSRYLLDPITAVVFSFTIPYLTYILADSIGFSGVLAVVVNGLIGARLVVTHESSLRRVFSIATWDVMIILVNCFVFILIGSQLSDLTAHMKSSQIILYSFYGLGITLVMFVVRSIWVFLKHSYFYFKFRGEKKLLTYFKRRLRDDTVIAWSGMRGIVSLTAALALPLTLPGGMPLPARNEVIFITFVVILLTLLIPGLTLPMLIRKLGLNEHNDNETQHALHIRKYLLEKAEEKIRKMYTLHQINSEQHTFLQSYVHLRFRVLEILSSKDPALRSLEIARRKVLRDQRRNLLQIWKQGKLDDRLMMVLERELDVEEAQSVRPEIG